MNDDELIVSENAAKVKRINFQKTCKDVWLKRQWEYHLCHPDQLLGMRKEKSRKRYMDESD